MANIRSCNKHNMIACVEKTAQNADFYQIIDFLTGCSINYSLLVDPDLIGPWLQQFWATATLQVINDVPHIRAKVAGKKILISEATIRADLLFDDENGVDCFPKQVIWDTLRDIGYEGNLAQLTFSKPLFSPQWKYLIHVLLHCLSPKSTSWEQFGTNIASALVGTASVQGTASFHDTVNSQRTAELQRTADFQGTAESHDAASIPKTPNDFTPTDASQTSGGLKAKLKKLSKLVAPVVKHHALWVENQNLKKQKRRRQRNKKKVSSVKLGRNKGEEILSEEHNVQEEGITTHHFADDTADQDAAVTPDVERKSDGTEEVNIEEKDASNVKSGETEELDLETTQSTARQGTITPRTLNFEDEAVKEVEHYRSLLQSQPQQTNSGCTELKSLGNDQMMRRLRTKKFDAEWEQERKQRKAVEDCRRKLMPKERRGDVDGMKMYKDSDKGRGSYILLKQALKKKPLH
ncbi:hypothetical protein Tco_0910581 [Tanacetum coccineum]|uniref:Uncharacterized protein n=1 Tax=Tanacetum coccineum TaxID=301880 RepID=A0ABQ5CT97_9ASTR